MASSYSYSSSEEDWRPNKKRGHILRLSTSGSSMESGSKPKTLTSKAPDRHGARPKGAPANSMASFQSSVASTSVSVSTKRWNSSSTTSKSKTVSNPVPVGSIPWNDSIQVKQPPMRPAISGIREKRRVDSAKYGPRPGPDIGRKNGFGRAIYTAKSYDEYDEDEVDVAERVAAQRLAEEEAKNRMKAKFPNQWRRSGLTTAAPAWSRVPIITKIDVARKSKMAILMFQGWDCLNPSPGGPNEPREFLDLPAFIRYKIYCKLTTPERVKLQQVCRDMRDDIRVRVGVGMFIDEKTKAGVAVMRDVMVDTVVVGNYRQPLLRPRDLIFRWYDVLHLKFKGAISLPYMDGFVNRCRGVQKVSVYGSVTERQPIPIDPEKKRDYRSWRKVELIRKHPYTLHYCKLLEIHTKGRNPHLTVQYTLEVCRCVNIVKLKVVNDKGHLADHTKIMHKAILKFIQAHPTLQDVWISSKVLDIDSSISTRKEYLMPANEIREASKNCQLRRIIILEGNVSFFTWAHFLTEQKQLEVMQVMHRIPNGYFDNVKANSNTLTKIAMSLMLSFDFHDHDFVKGDARELDLSVFEDCHVLKSLYIRLNSSPKAVQGLPNLAREVKNFASLPLSLEDLALYDVTLNTEDFGHVARLKKLKHLGVIFAPVMEGARMIELDRELFGKIFWMRSLEELALQHMYFTHEMRFAVNRFKGSFYHMVPDTKHTLYFRHKNPKNRRWAMHGKTDRAIDYKFEDDDITYEV